MNINDLLVELDRRDTLLANDAASKIRELLKENERLAEVEKDAKRYRFWVNRYPITFPDADDWTPERIDSATDAAMNSKVNSKVNKEQP